MFQTYQKVCAIYNAIVVIIIVDVVVVVYCMC